MRPKAPIALLIVLLGLWGIDRYLGPDGDRGSEYGRIQNQSKRLKAKPNASILILGQSTTGQWLTPRNLGRLLNVPHRKILDGHLSGCHPDCTYAEVRRLLAEGRHFDEIYFGVNLFTLCEGESRRRVAAELLTLPVEDTFLMASHYWETREPSRYFGAMAALSISHAYWDPPYVQRRLTKGWITPRSTPNWWMNEGHVDRLAEQRGIRKDKPKPIDRSCALDEEERIAFKMSVLRALVKDLGKLADHTYVMALPDRSVTQRRHNTAMKKRWQMFPQLLQEVVRTEPRAELVDLATHGAGHKSHYRDAFHLSRRGKKHQDRVLTRYLRSKRTEPDAGTKPVKRKLRRKKAKRK